MTSFFNKYSTIQEFKEFIRGGAMHHLLSTRINRNNDVLMTLDQRAYATELLKATGILNAKEASGPEQSSGKRFAAPRASWDPFKKPESLYIYTIRNNILSI